MEAGEVAARDVEAPQFPVGPFVPEDGYGHPRREEFITEIAQAPAALRAAVRGLTDSHLNAFVRFKLTLTEDRPTIKPYDEGRWVGLLRAMTAEQFARTYIHPEARAEVSLAEALSNYAWHGRHHTAQILWVRRHRLGLAD